MIELLLLLAPFLAFLVAAFVVVRWTFQRSSALLDHWAEQNGYRILAREHRWYFCGPFISSHNRTIYRVTVDDRGLTRTGWARCGSFWTGLYADVVEVRWDPPVSSPDCPGDEQA